MDGPTFDRIARVLVGRDNRRDWLRGMVAVAAATFVPAAPVQAAADVTASHKHHKHHSKSSCKNDHDCAKCQWCDSGTCERLPNGYPCSDGLGACKKGRCRIASPKLRVDAEPPCVTATASGLKPGSACQFQLSSPCYPGGGAGTEVGPDGTAVLPENCGNCTLFCPGTQDTSITVEARGTAAKTNKHCKLTETVDNVACVSLP